MRCGFILHIRKMRIYNVKEITILEAQFLNLNNEKLGFFRYPENHP